MAQGILSDVGFSGDPVRHGFLRRPRLRWSSQTCISEETPAQAILLDVFLRRPWAQEILSDMSF